MPALAAANGGLQAEIEKVGEIEDWDFLDCRDCRPGWPGLQRLPAMKAGVAGSPRLPKFQYEIAKEVADRDCWPT